MPKKRRKNTIEERNARIERDKQMLDELRQKETDLRKKGDIATAGYVHNKQVVPLWRSLSKDLQPKAQPMLTLAREIGYDVKPLVQLIIKIHLTADYLTDIIGRVQDEMDKIGASHCNFYVVTEAAFKQLQFLASMMAGEKNEALTTLVVDDDDLISCMDKLVDEYLKSRGMTPDCWISAQEEHVSELDEDKQEKNLYTWQRKHQEREKAKEKERGVKLTFNHGNTSAH